LRKYFSEQNGTIKPPQNQMCIFQHQVSAVGYPSSGCYFLRQNGEPVTQNPQMIIRYNIICYWLMMLVVAVGEKNSQEIKKIPIINPVL